MRRQKINIKKQLAVTVFCLPGSTSPRPAASRDVRHAHWQGCVTLPLSALHHITGTDKPSYICD